MAAVEDYLDDLRKHTRLWRRHRRNVPLPAAWDQPAERRGRRAEAQGAFCINQVGRAGRWTSRFRPLCRQTGVEGPAQAGAGPGGRRGRVVKPAGDDAWLTADSDQVSRYWERYRLVLVTNTRDFVLLGEDSQGQPSQAGDLPAGRLRRRLRGEAATPPRLRQQRRPGAGRVPGPRPVPPGYAGRTPRLGPAPGLLRPRRAGPCRGVGRRLVAERRAVGAGGGAGREVRGRAGRGLLPLNAGADPLLRRLLGLGAVGAADSGSSWAPSTGAPPSGTCAPPSCRPCFSR